MIDEKILLQELDEMIKIQQKSVERAEQESNEAVVYLESKELAAYMRIRNIIKEKSAQEAATSKGTINDINSLSQKQYNTDQKKIEPIKLAQEIFALCMKIQEGEDGKVEHRRKGRCSGPTVFVDFYGHVAQLDVEISLDGWPEEEGRKEKFSFYMGDYWNHQEEEQAIKCKERLTELLEERRGNDDEE